MKKIVAKIIFLCLLLSNSFLSIAQNNLVYTGKTQSDFINAYKLALFTAINDYHSTDVKFDTNLFPAWGEHSVYWVTQGANKGDFVIYPNIGAEYNNVSLDSTTTFDWKNEDSKALHFKPQANSIAIFQAKDTFAGQTLNWESVYFKYSIESFLYRGITQYISEKQIIDNGISENTKVLIIPAFAEVEDDPKAYIDTLFDKYPNLSAKINAFLSTGGTLYTEGNAAYFVSKLGYIDSADIAFNASVSPSNSMAAIQFEPNAEPFSLLAESDSLYASSIPQVNISNGILARLKDDNRPVIFKLQSGGGTILCNLGLPTAGGYPGVADGSRQLQYLFNAVLSAYLSPIDVTRSVFNQIPDSITVGDNGIAYDAIDTFDVNVKVRNLGYTDINNINITENISQYFTFAGISTVGVNYTIENKELKFTGINLAAHTELNIKYKLVTPAPEDSIHENVDQYIVNGSYIAASNNTTSFNLNNKSYTFNKFRNYVDVMFSARIVADADVNWKNFLGLDYQPFKVFMIMENKERTSAVNTVYTQYVPKDVPYYGIDHGLNIPILKTPGGKYIDILKGSNDENNPDYDMDSDGKPDAWLDTTSIYPKGYTITEDSVYWENPWAHLKDTTLKGAVYEDIDHDGKVAQDTDGDGVVDVEEPGDKIRVWKITWNIATVQGYQYYDPYCSYELWLDPPDLVPLSKGVGYANGKIAKDSSMFYPYSPDIDNVNLNDTSWSYWMERDSSGNVVWKNLIRQSISNYEGFAYVDTDYVLKPTDSLIGLVPKPSREFIAVVSLGGEEIDMTHPTPSHSSYSNVDYNTIFNEHRVTPIRTTYTYYAPLPNPLQFEYLSNGFTLTDYTTNDTLKYLPKYGKANILFNVSASTEYSYYWIRNVGYDVDYNDPSLALDSVESFGDGVFGYFIFEIPKGFGDYKITLPTDSAGAYDVGSLLQVDGKDFSKWIDNPNTLNEVEVWQTPFTYQVYVPQLLIPPAIDDDNFDGIDDWIDDRGDRFSSKTGYLHDGFMIGDGEDYPKDSAGVFAHDDFEYGVVDSGWYAGADSTYGDDHFETLGKTRLAIKAIYQGKGKEGPVEIGKGGTLVVEEIFGGSPWVIHSHVLNAYAIGMDITLQSELYPQNPHFGVDTVLLKYSLQDADEPHEFNDKFSPFTSSFGYGYNSATTLVGGKDPCSLITPDLETFSIIDMDFDTANITLMSFADTATNGALTDFPKQVSGTFVMLKVEINNGSDNNWKNIKLQANLPDELKNSEIVMNYVAYPRPLVPGDNIGSFTAGWRFNQPEGEVLVQLGDSLPLLQPSRRAYFITLVKLDSTLQNGVYTVPFSLSGNEVYYTGDNPQELNFDIPEAKFSITDKDERGRPLSWQKIVIGQGSLTNITTNGTDILTPLQNVKYSLQNIHPNDFDTLAQSLPATANANTETIDLSQFKVFPKADTAKLFILEQAQTDIQSTEDTLATYGQVARYNFMDKDYEVPDTGLSITPMGPMLEITKKVLTVNGKEYKGEAITLQDSVIILGIQTSLRNYGNDMAQEVNLQIFNDSNYIIIPDSLPARATIVNNYVLSTFGTIIPGQTQAVTLYYRFVDNDEDDLTEILDYFNSEFNGVMVNSPFYVIDSIPLALSVYDFKLKSITFDSIDNQKVSIKALAVNRGIPAQNVSFSILPVQDSTYGDPIGQTVIYTYNNRQYAELSADFSLNTENGNYLFAGIIDADNQYTELFENNNNKQITITVDNTTVVNQLANATLSIYPNPVKENLSINYKLVTQPQSIKISIINLKGQVLQTQIINDFHTGNNEYNLKLSQLSKGAYIYKFEAQYPENTIIQRGIFIK